MSEPSVSSPDPSRRRLGLSRILRLAFAALTLGVLLGLAGPLTLLVFIAETRSGRMAGAFTCLFLAAATCAIALFLGNGRSWLWPAVAILSTLAALLAGVMAWNTAPGVSDDSSALQSRFLGTARYRRYATLNFVPEVDQIKLGVNLATRLVPALSGPRARRLRQEIVGLAREIDQDPNGRALGSVGYLALDELLGREVQGSHYYAYIPAHRPNERLGAIVFLHGNGGNFKVMPWLWRTFADQHRFVIVCPTFGFGFWNDGGVEAVERARADAISWLPIDPKCVYLGGVSDGGKGVTRTGRVYPSHYQGLIYVSPTMIVSELDSPAFVDGWRNRPVLVVHGARDVNVPKATVDPAVDHLLRNQVRVEYSVYPDEDHFLFFAQRQSVLDRIARWMKSADPDSGRPPFAPRQEK